jgi:hypothetical protein
LAANIEGRLYHYSYEENYFCRLDKTMKFTLQNTDPKSNARAGVIKTDHGSIETPIFMPVGTAGTVKAVHQRELHDDVAAHIICI